MIGTLSLEKKTHKKSHYMHFNHRCSYFSIWFSFCFRIHETTTVLELDKWKYTTILWNRKNQVLLRWIMVHVWQVLLLLLLQSSDPRNLPILISDLGWYGFRSYVSWSLIHGFVIPIPSGPLSKILEHMFCHPDPKPEMTTDHVMTVRRLMVVTIAISSIILMSEMSQVKILVVRLHW